MNTKSGKVVIFHTKFGRSKVISWRLYSASRDILVKLSDLNLKFLSYFKFLGVITGANFELQLIVAISCLYTMLGFLPSRRYSHFSRYDGQV